MKDFFHLLDQGFLRNFSDGLELHLLYQKRHMNWTMIPMPPSLIQSFPLELFSCHACLHGYFCFFVYLIFILLRANKNYEFRPNFLSRISLSDIWRPASKKYCGNNPWKMLKTSFSILLSKSVLQVSLEI